MKKKLLRKKKRSERVRTFKKIFIQGWGTHGDETIIAVGVTMSEIIKYLKKIKALPRSIEALTEESDHLSDTMKSSKGFFAKPGDGKVGSLLWLREWDKTWECAETLVHELFHAVYITLGKGKSMMEEQEAMAYQQEFLFGEIRRKLNKK